MKKYIQSATLSKYNANSRGKNVGDCVKRSISLAFDMPYNDVQRILNSQMRDMRKTQWNIKSVFEPVIMELGSSPLRQMREELGDITVGEFADDYAKPGRVYILLSGEKRNSSGHIPASHMVCVRNKEVWDSWDSRDYLVQSYYLVKESVNRKELTDIKEHLSNLHNEYFVPTVYDEIARYMNRKKWDGDFVEKYHKDVDYCMISRFTVSLQPIGEFITKIRNYTFEIRIPVEPTMTVEEAIDHIKKVSKQRAYDRMYAINEQENNLAEAEAVKVELGQKYKGQPASLRWLTDQEAKFLNSLPGWVKPLVQFISVDKPGRYSDSYQIKLLKLPDDYYHDDIETFTLSASDSYMIKDMLNKYKENYEIEGIDYNYDY